MKIVFKVNFIILALLWVLLSSCKREKQEVRYYPSAKDFTKVRIDLIGIDTLNINYDSLMNRFYKNYENGVKTVIEIKNKGVTRKIMFIYTYNGCIRTRRILMISEDSIFKESGFSISELENVLRKHYFNIDRNNEYPYSYEDVFVNIALDTGKTITKLRNDLKNSLLNLTENFDKIKKDTTIPLKLYLFLENVSRFPPPPPPPSIEQIEVIFKDSNISTLHLRKKINSLINSSIKRKPKFKQFLNSVHVEKVKENWTVEYTNDDNPELLFSGFKDFDLNLGLEVCNDENLGYEIRLSYKFMDYYYKYQNISDISPKFAYFKDLVKVIKELNKTYKEAMILYTRYGFKSVFTLDSICMNKNYVENIYIGLIPENFNINFDTTYYSIFKTSKDYTIWTRNSMEWSRK